MARPREFDPEQALERAMYQFWDKGYHDTSIRDLVERTGVNYYGLYAVFDNKHGLFLSALDHYRKIVTDEILRELEQPGPVRSVIRRTLERVAALMRTSDGRVGCLMCNTAIELAPHDREAAAKVQAHMTLLRTAFHERLSSAAASGELGGIADLAALAEFFSTTVYVIGLLVRSGCGDALIGRHIQTALKALE